jgi:hypothetical protein
MKIASYGKADRMKRIKESMAGKVQISEADLVAAYESDKNVKEVRTRIHTSSCNVVIGKLSAAKAGISDSEREFLHACGNNTYLNMFPSQQKRLDSLIAKVHTKEKECSIGDSSLMDLETFEKVYLPYIRKMQAQMDSIKEDIRDEFDDRMDEFEAETLSIVKKMFPDKEESVLTQLAYLRSRGKDGYLSKISIEIETKFGEDETEHFDEEMRDFLSKCKEASAQHQAENIICSLFDELWQAVLSYAINISLERYESSSDLSNFKSLRNKLLARALKVRREAKPLEALGGSDITDLTKKVEALSLVIDKYDAPDNAYDCLVEIYTVAREHYGYELDLSSKHTRANIPEWINMDDIISDAELVISSSPAPTTPTPAPTTTPNILGGGSTIAL